MAGADGDSVEADGGKLGAGQAGGGGSGVRGLVLKAVCLLGGVFLVRKLTKSKTKWDHARCVADALMGEKFTIEQATRAPLTFFNLRMIACPATALADGTRVLYSEQAFWRTLEKPYRQRFLVVKPCPKELKCDVEVSSYAIKDADEYKNFCERPTTQRPQPNEVEGDIAEYLASVYLSRCERGRNCLYEGSTPPGGFPNNWNGATRCTSEMTIYKNGAIDSWDRGYDDDGKQMWGLTQGPYHFKPGSSKSSSFIDFESHAASALPVESGKT